MSSCYAIACQVPNKEQAGIFYGEGLGLAADPGSTAAQRGGVMVTWFNIGRQQVNVQMHHQKWH